MKPSISFLTLIIAVLAIAEGNHNAGKKFRPRQYNFNPVQPVITVYKFAEQSDIPDDFAAQPHKYEVIPVGDLQNGTLHGNARNGLCIITRRRKRSIYIQKEFINHEEEKNSGSRKGKSRSYSGYNIKIKQPFIFRGYLSESNAAPIEQQFKPANEHTYFRGGNPNKEHQQEGGRPLRFFPIYSPPPPPPTSSSYPWTSSSSYPWTSSSWPFPSGSTFPSGPLVVSGPGVIQASNGGSQCTIVTRAFDLNAGSVNGQTLRLRRRSN